MKQEADRDDFLDGLELGVWDDEFDYYRPLSEIKKLGELAIEPEVTTQEDMKSGEW